MDSTIEQLYLLLDALGAYEGQYADTASTWRGNDPFSVSAREGAKIRLERIRHLKAQILAQINK